MVIKDAAPVTGTSPQVISLRLGLEMIKTFKFFLYIATLFLFYGCIIYPTTHVYFEPSSSDGYTIDSTQCEHLSEEKDEIRMEYNNVNFSISARYRKNQKLVVDVLIEPRGNKIELNPDFFKIVDNKSQQEFTPITSKIEGRIARIATSVFKSEEVYRQWITLDYDVMSDTLSDFSLIFPEGAIEINSTFINISPVRFIMKKRKTFGYGSINC
jgi:hypothetical protein